MSKAILSSLPAATKVSSRRATQCQTCIDTSIRASFHTTSLLRDSPPTTKHNNSASSPAYPLYPSVQHLLHQHNLPLSEASQIPASGPRGRLLKGDVLAYLGRIGKSYSSDLSKRVQGLGYLDLSHVKAEVKEKVQPGDEKGKGKDAPVGMSEDIERSTEIAVPISLAKVLAVQKRIQDSLGIFLPVSTFISRATEVANDDLPAGSQTRTLTADELFDQVLGLDKVNPSKTSRGYFTPQITALQEASTSSHSSLSATQKQSSTSTRPRSDIYDLLAGQTPPSAKKSTSPVLGKTGMSMSMSNVFSVAVTKGDESRGRVFLERVKTVLEREPGRLVI